MQTKWTGNKYRPAAELEIEQPPGFLPRFNFGKHVGKIFKEVLAADPSYWIVDKSDLDAAVKHTAPFWLSRKEPP